MQRRTMMAFGIGLVAGGLAIGTTAATAQPDFAATGAASAVAVADDDRDRGRHGPRGEELTGSDAEAATAAAEGAVPGGTVLRVATHERDNAAYHALVEAEDGSKSVVLLAEDFSVISVEEPRQGPVRHGPRGGENAGNA